MKPNIPVTTNEQLYTKLDRTKQAEEKINKS